MATGGPSRCRPRSLVRGRIGRVELCADCGCVSIHLGPATVRLDEHSLRTLWVMLGQAVEMLEQPRCGSYPITPARGSA